MLYQSLNDKNAERVDSTLLFPLKNENKRMIGILEITNYFNDLFGFDEEYFGIILSVFTNNLVNNLIRNEVLNNEIKYNLFILFFYFVLKNSQIYKKNLILKKINKRFFLIFW